MVIAEKGPESSPRVGVLERFPELQEIPDNKFPKNVFIIPDGNGRWAEAHGLHVSEGHKKGADVIANAFEDFHDLRRQIPYVGVWGLSVDNLKRSKEEVDFLMSLFNHAVQDFEPKLIARDNRFMHIGRRDIYPNHPLWETIDRVEGKTRDNKGQTVYVAIGFSGKDQIVRITQTLVEQARFRAPFDVTEEMIDALRDGGGIIPEADLIIRSSGEHRLSGLGWLQGNGTELHWDDTLFPDFTTENFVDGIVAFTQRDRRFGGRSKSKA